MATVYSSEVSVGSYNRIRLKCDYSGTSASFDIQFRRTSAYTGSWADSQSSLTFNSQNKPAVYSYSGNVGTSWVTIVSNISGFTIPVGGGTYSWRFNNPGNYSVLGCSGSITIPTQVVAPTKPTISVTRGVGSNVVTYGTTSFGTPSTGTVYLYGGTSSTPTTQISSKTTTGNSGYTHSGLNAGTTYYYRARAYNGQAYSDYSSVVSAKTYTAPTTPTLSVSSTTIHSVVITYGTTSFGDPSTGTVYLYGGTATDPTTQIASKTTTGNSNYTWSSRAANTKYYFRSRASNSQTNSSYASSISAVTKPTAATVSVSSYSKTSITISWSTTADGGAYNKTIQYSINGGSTWVNGKTDIAGAASSGTFTISGLTAGTSYTIQTRTTTTAGNTTGTTLTQKTRQSATTPTISKNDAQQTSNKITYGTTSFGYPNDGTVYLYGGTSASPTTQLTSKTTTGNSTYTHSGLTGNTKYYYRARAKNTGLDEFTNYTSDLTIITKPAAPTITTTSVSQQSATVKITVPTQGSGATMTLYYSVDGGTAVSAGTIASGGTKSVTLTFSPGTQHTVSTYLSNSTGNSSSNSVTFTMIDFLFYGSVSGKTKKIKKLYGSTGGLDVLPNTFDGTTNGRGISFTLSEKTLTLNGQNDNTGNSVYYITRIGSQPSLTLRAGTYHCATPGNRAVSMVLYDGATYYDLVPNNNYTQTVPAGSYTVYVQVSKGNTTEFNNFTYGPKLYDYTGHTVEITKLYGSVNGETKRIF